MERRFPGKEFMPIAIDVGKKKIVLIGGGRIALQKVEVLMRYTNNLHIVAPEVCRSIKVKGVSYIEKKYELSDLDDAFIVYACTNISDLNRTVAEDCRDRNILINVVDNPAMCDFVTPAIYKKDYVSIAVTSNAQSVLKSIEVRNKIKNFLENDPIPIL